ncbi:MAG: hypothetical protein ACK457_02765, partial [Flavobacteriia bacterium]
VYRLHSRSALTEFLKRIFLQLNVPLHSFVDNYFRNGNIMELSTKKGILELNVALLTQWVGIVRKLPGDFDFVGTTTEFIDEHRGHFLPSAFFVPVRKDLKTLSDQAIKDAGTVAEFFTDMISQDHFLPYGIKKENQYSREPVDYACFELNRAVMFDPLKELNEITLRTIKLKIGLSKLVPADEFIECTEEDRLNEIIRIGFGIKNGYIDVRGPIYGYKNSVDPYFFFMMGPVMDVFLKSESFMDLYHYWSMCDWIDLVPEG